MKTYEPTYEEIEQRARNLWSTQGQPVGRDEEIWLEAERQLRNRKGPADSNSTPRSGAARAADAAPKSIEQAVDPIENDPIEERLSKFGEPTSRGATSL